MQYAQKNLISDNGLLTLESHKSFIFIIRKSTRRYRRMNLYTVSQRNYHGL